jgi:archaemetzincin
MWYGEAKKIYILPFGRLPEALLEVIAEALEKTFGKKTAIISEAPLPLEAYSRERQQCNSTRVIEMLAAMRFDGMVLGVLDADLYATGLNFVFGEADAVEGVAVISVTRLREEFYGRGPDWPLLLERAVKEAIHEAGHLYGLRHCADHSCVMSFSNLLEDTDRKTKRFCADCRERLKDSAAEQ